MMKLIGKNILFKSHPPKTCTDGGILIPETASEINNKGTVIAVGNKVTKVKEGETVYRVKDWGNEVVIEGQKYFIMDENAIIAKQ